MDLKLAAEQTAGPCNNRVDVRIKQGDVGFASEVAHMVDDITGPIHLSVDFRGQLGERVRIDGFSTPCFAQEITGRSLDDGERLIQFVGYAGGHFPESRHLAGLNELLFHFDAFGNICRTKDEDRAILDPGRGRTDIHPQECAVSPDVGHTGKDSEGAQLRGILLTFLRQEQVEDAGSDKRIARASVHLDGCRVAVGDIQVDGIKQEHCIGNAVENGFMGAFGNLQLGLEGTNERHVDAHLHDRRNLPAAVEKRDSLYEPVVARTIRVDAAFLRALDEAGIPCADDGTFRAGRRPVLIDFIAGLP